MRFFIGFIFIAIGALIIWKARTFEEWFGSIGWAETHLGTEGGSRTFYILLGLGCILLAFFIVSNLFVTLVTRILPLQNI